MLNDFIQKRNKPIESCMAGVKIINTRKWMQYEPYLGSMGWTWKAITWNQPHIKYVQIQVDVTNFPIEVNTITEAVENVRTIRYSTINQ